MEEKTADNYPDEPIGECTPVELESSLEIMRQFFAAKFALADSGDKQKVIEDLTFYGLIKHWRKTGFKNIITMVGAGISTSAGIPDFRSPGSGLYDNLQKYNLPHPTSIFEMDYFRRNPQPFFALAKELYPGTFNPTPAHYFVRLLHEKGLLVRHYTQNIDTLERIAGIPDEKLVEAHGTFHTSHCLGCRKVYSVHWMKKQIFSDQVPTCISCNSVVKPDIVFFGENMPDKFYKLPPIDFENCDLLIIMGTSLEVQPFASLIDNAGPKCLRLLINRDKVGLRDSWFAFGPGLRYGKRDNLKDIAFVGNCDDGVYALADALGWGDELRSLVKSEHARLLETSYSERSSELTIDGKEMEILPEETTSSVKSSELFKKEDNSTVITLAEEANTSAKTSELFKKDHNEPDGTNISVDGSVLLKKHDNSTETVVDVSDVGNVKKEEATVSNERGSKG